MYFCRLDYFTRVSVDLHYTTFGLFILVLVIAAIITLKESTEVIFFIILKKYFSMVIFRLKFSALISAMNGEDG